MEYGPATRKKLLPLVRGRWLRRRRRRKGCEADARCWQVVGSKLKVQSFKTLLSGRACPAVDGRSRDLFEGNELWLRLRPPERNGQAQPPGNELAVAVGSTQV